MMASKPTDDEILAAVRDGGRTRIIADRASRFYWGQYIYRRLRILERKGKVVRHPLYSFNNSIYWVKP